MIPAKLLMTECVLKLKNGMGRSFKQSVEYNDHTAVNSVKQGRVARIERMHTLNTQVFMKAHLLTNMEPC